eukprot:1160129-Pelagomonas_calceolata.AAC.6
MRESANIHGAAKARTAFCTVRSMRHAFEQHLSRLFRNKPIQLITRGTFTTARSIQRRNTGPHSKHPSDLYRSRGHLVLQPGIGI